MSLLTKNKQIILYGLELAVFAFILRWIEIRFLLADEDEDTYIGFIAIIFTALGIWLAIKLRKPVLKTVVVEKAIYRQDFVLNHVALKRLNLSKRELEVLELMAQGLSNQEIADKLFVSLNTIKTHSAQLFEKMEVKRRTQAIDMGKKMGIIP